MCAARTIFLTGFPGFIAGRLIELLAQDDQAQFLLLVHPSMLARAHRQLVRLEARAPNAKGRFKLLAGDITEPNLGLRASELERARREATTLFHLAAVYDLAVDRETAMRVNVEGTRNVNRFALDLQNLARYNYVSTCYVAGKRRGMIREDELVHSAGFRNYYEESKYLAEVEVAALRRDLPVTIYRPSVVCGDSQTGETAKYDGIYYLINYILMQPDLLSLVNIGNKRVRLNVVPVDFVVRAMATLANDERAAGATVHLADPDPLTTYDLFETIAEAVAGHGSRLHVPPTLVRSTLQLPFSEAITGLPRVGVPYFFIEQTYDTTRARALLDPHGISCPPFASYVRALVDFARRHPEL
ncbi:SDR family oxidoreductase [Pyrinomonas sp.]|uniref:SDR family oxidoreductase n=1 Tax=Pyrinomonas sp. TaxID=2080306 RepID=UPI0033329F7D